MRATLMSRHALMVISVSFNVFLGGIGFRNELCRQSLISVHHISLVLLLFINTRLQLTFKPWKHAFLSISRNLMTSFTHNTVFSLDLLIRALFVIENVLKGDHPIILKEHNVFYLHDSVGHVEFSTLSVVSQQLLKLDHLMVMMMLLWDIAGKNRLLRQKFISSVTVGVSISCKRRLRQAYFIFSVASFQKRCLQILRGVNNAHRIFW